MTRRIFQNCCSRIKRWSIESNFILWLCGRQGVVECFSVNFEKKLTTHFANLLNHFLTGSSYSLRHSHAMPTLLATVARAKGHVSVKV